MSTKQSYHESNILTHAKVLRADVLRAALAYAGKGIPVFPLHSVDEGGNCSCGGKPGCKPGKHPRTKHGFHDATTDASRITAWWNRYPEANIGIPTGKRTGLLVLDVDHPAGLDALEAEHGKLTATRTHSTGSGGMHRLYRYPAGEHFGNSSGDLPDGYDIRGEGGYIVAPPSATTRPYEVLDRLPLGDAPEWLLEALRHPHSAAVVPTAAGIGTETPRSSGPIGGPIPDGRRNGTLFKYGCALRAQGFEQAAILEELKGTNGKLCRPPLDAGEVEKIALSASRYEPGNASPGPDAETLEALDGIEAASLWGRSWKGQRWKSPRSVMVGLIREARKHGQTTKAGVRVSISVRSLALAVEVSQPTLILALDKLEAENIIRRIKGSGTKSNAYVLITPSVARLYHSTTGAASSLSAKGQPHPFTAPRLRYSKPVYDSLDGVSRRVGTVLRLGKTAEHVLDILERRGGWITVADLGAELDIKHHRDLRRRTLPRLASVVEWSGDALRLRSDWLAALNRKRQEDQELDDHERDKKKYAEESRVYALKVETRKLERVGMDPEEIASELEIGMEDAYRLLEIARPVQPDGYTEELERVEEIPVEDFSDCELKPVQKPDPIEDFSGIELKPLSPLAVALRDYLDAHPDDVHQSPYWLGATLWAFDLYPEEPTRHEVRDALEELGQSHLKAVA